MAPYVIYKVHHWLEEQVIKLKNECDFGDFMIY